MASSTTTMRTTTEGPSGSSSVTKTTTYETRSSSSYVADSATPSYRPTIAPRTYIIQRTAIGGLGSAPGGGSATRTIERSAQFSALQAGAPAGRQTDNVAHSYYLISREDLSSIQLYTHTEIKSNFKSNVFAIKRKCTI